MDHIEVKNLVPDFIDFFDEASRRSMSEKKRFDGKKPMILPRFLQGLKGKRLLGQCLQILGRNTLEK